jgi:capsular polysaccharide biosynthesis protein
MDDEFDLRRYVNVLVKYGSLLLAAALAGGLLAGATSLFVLPVRHSTAAIVVTGAPTLRVSLGSAVLPSSEAKVPAKAYAAMAKNSSLLQEVVESMGDSLP